MRALLPIVLLFSSALADEIAKPTRTPDEILNQYCNVCHVTGWNGALPKAEEE
jgi:hypothetical protein